VRGASPRLKARYKGRVLTAERLWTP